LACRGRGALPLLVDALHLNPSPACFVGLRSSALAAGLDWLDRLLHRLDGLDGFNGLHGLHGLHGFDLDRFLHGFDMLDDLLDLDWLLRRLDGLDGRPLRITGQSAEVGHKSLFVQLLGSAHREHREK